MALFLQILGGIFLAIILVLAAGALFIGLKVRRVFNTIQELSDSAGLTPPQTVRLRPMARPCWDDEDSAAEIAERLPDLGFTPIGLYQINEIEGLNLAAFLNAADRAYAVVYEHPEFDVWVDFVTRFEDGSVFTYANSADPDGVVFRPGVVVRRFPDLEVAALYQRFLADRPEEGIVTPTAERFPAEFERIYAKDMAWRVKNARIEGGMSVLTALSGDGDEDMDYEEEDEQPSLEHQILTRFLETTTMTALQWEAIRDRLLIVHESMDPDDLVMAFFQEGEEPEWTPKQPYRKSFAAHNKRVDEHFRFVKLGTVEDPVPADLYAAPGC